MLPMEWGVPYRYCRILWELQAESLLLDLATLISMQLPGVPDTAPTALFSGNVQCFHCAHLRPSCIRKSISRTEQNQQALACPFGTTTDKRHGRMPRHHVLQICASKAIMMLDVRDTAGQQRCICSTQMMGMPCKIRVSQQLQVVSIHQACKRVKAAVSRPHH